MWTEWAGVRFLVLGAPDARRIRLPGLFAFVRHAAGRSILLIDHADLISATAGPAHPAWDAARDMGLNEVHVNIQPMTRLDRLQLLSRIIRACEPPLNRRGVDEGDVVMNPAWEAGAALP